MDGRHLADLGAGNDETGLCTAELAALGVIMPAPGCIVEGLHVGLAKHECPFQHTLGQGLGLFKLQLQVEAVALVCAKGRVVLQKVVHLPVKPASSPACTSHWATG